MSNEIKIYGHSDDLIEIEGALDKELYAEFNEPTILEITPGYVLEVVYDNDGIWRLYPEELPENANYEHIAAEDTDTYSDTVRINEPGVDYEIEKLDGDAS